VKSRDHYRLCTCCQSVSFTRASEPPPSEASVLLSESVMEDVLATAEGVVLVKLVKVAQKLGLKGENGTWKEFLDFYDKQLGSSSLSDPSKRRKDDLVAFLTTLKKKEDLQLLAKSLKLDNDVFEKFKKKSLDETAEQCRG